MTVLLGPVVAVHVHPIDTDAHPTVPPGWRWAVVVGDRPPHDLVHTVQAGWAPTESQAWFEGEHCGVAVCKGLRLFGIPVDYRKLRLTTDPIPPDLNRIDAGMVHHAAKESP